MNPSGPRMRRGDCPKWCCGQHGDPVASDETIHSSCLAAIPVVIRPRTLVMVPDIFDAVPGSGDAPMPDSQMRPDDVAPDELRDDDWRRDEVAYFEVIRLQSALGGDEWVYIGSEPNALMVTVESARRIFRAMGQILGS